MIKKKVLLLSHNFYPEPVGMGKYNGEMINWLAGKGHDCTVVTTFPYYPYWKVQPPYKNRWYKKEIIPGTAGAAAIKIYRCPSYIPSNPTGLRRTMQDFSYWISKFFTIFRLILSRQKFDLIITVAPPFHLAYLGLLARKLTGGKLLYHIQDLQIEAARDLKLFSNDTVLKVLFKMERDILNGADYVSSISDGMIRRINTKVKREITFFPNWVDTDEFTPLPDREKLKLRWGYQSNDVVFLYSGAIGVKQGLDTLLDAAEQLLSNQRIKFVICSSGPYKDQLEAIAQSRKLANVSFYPLQAKEKFNEFLNMADVHLVMQKANASDLVMPSKLTAILATGGVSVITTSKGTTLGNLVETYKLGYLVEPGSVDLLVAKILEVAYSSSLDEKRRNARAYAINNLNIDRVMGDFGAKFLI